MKEISEGSTFEKFLEEVGGEEDNLKELFVEDKTYRKWKSFAEGYRGELKDERDK